MEAKVSEIQIDMSSLKQSCSICLNDKINADQMFTVDRCLHTFCSECVKRYIEVSLLKGRLVRCPHHRCENFLSFRSCFNLLTPKQTRMWEERIKEESIPVTKRVYCPNPRCSALMSEIELSILPGVRRCCVQCGEPFCMNCRVLWHNDLTCERYKELNPVPTKNERKLQILARQKMWRQCGKCHHMIELSQGCTIVRCRCGHRFCYQCGADVGACRRADNGACRGADDGASRQDEFWLPCLCGFITLFLLFAIPVVTFSFMK